jgi:hypothetical protein
MDRRCLPVELCRKESRDRKIAPGCLTAFGLYLPNGALETLKNLPSPYHKAKFDEGTLAAVCSRRLLPGRGPLVRDRRGPSPEYVVHSNGKTSPACLACVSQAQFQVAMSALPRKLTVAIDAHGHKHSVTSERPYTTTKSHQQVNRYIRFCEICRDL